MMVTQDHGMQTWLRCQGRSCLICVSGRITIDSSPDLRTLLLQQLESTGCERLTVDLYEVVYVDTSCLAVLLEVQRAARAQKKTFYLSGLRDGPRYLLEETRILHQFDEVARDGPQLKDGVGDHSQ
jgi:anti-anti-sigma factor